MQFVSIYIKPVLHASFGCRNTNGSSTRSLSNILITILAGMSDFPYMVCLHCYEQRINDEIKVLKSPNVVSQWSKQRFINSIRILLIEMQTCPYTIIIHAGINVFYYLKVTNQLLLQITKQTEICEKRDEHIVMRIKSNHEEKLNHLKTACCL